MLLDRLALEMGLAAEEEVLRGREGARWELEEMWGRGAWEVSFWFCFGFGF